MVQAPSNIRPHGEIEPVCLKPPIRNPSDDTAKTSASAVEQVDALCATAASMQEQEPQRALSLAQQATQLARARSYTRGLAKALQIIGGCHGMMGDTEPALHHLEEALTLSRDASDQAAESACLHLLGVVHSCSGNSPAALQCTLQAIALRQNEPVRLLGQSLNNAGIIFFNLGDHPSALRYFHETRQIHDALSDLAGLASLLTNLGNVSVGMGQYQRALEYHQECIGYARQSGRTVSEVSGLCNSAEAYNHLGRYDEALEASQHALRLAQLITFPYADSSILLNMAHSYNELDQTDQATLRYEEALAMAHTAGNKEYQCRVSLEFGRFRLKNGDLPGARRYLIEAAAVASQSGLRLFLAQTHRALSDLHEQEGDYAGALEQHRLFHVTEKEIFNHAADQRAKALMIQMEVEKAQKTAELHRRQNQELAQANEALAQANTRLEALATLDPLTDLPNHRAMIAFMDEEVARSAEQGRVCAVLFLDIDHFKTVNDTYGHAAGDAALRQFARQVRGCLRDDDTLGRWGGEEFVAVLPRTDPAHALQVAERARAAVAEQVFDIAGGLRLTCSIGVACYPYSGTERRTLVHAADQAMYQAKRQGRNQVRTAALAAPPAFVNSLP